METSKPETVDEYIGTFPSDIQKLLKQMRTTIKKVAPDAQEGISYNMPLYKLNGMLVSFAAWKNHIGLYPSPIATGELKKRLMPYEGAKATLRFRIDKPLPLKLIEQAVRLRIQENVARAKRKASAKK
jgi:uncharacterized protein YdhG (YjbR/CyaY superfamily)